MSMRREDGEMALTRRDFKQIDLISLMKINQPILVAVKLLLPGADFNIFISKYAEMGYAPAS
jgi:hypothetical protein